MASKYIKIPVYQIAVSTKSPDEKTEEFEKSYSKIIKTLRIPQEALTSTTGSLYWGGTTSPEAGSQITLASGVTQLVENQYTVLETKYQNFDLGNLPVTGDFTSQGGLWMQIPLNTSRVLWDNQLGEVGPASNNSPETYNKTLWLRISQEVISKSTTTGNMITQYTYPQLVGLGKTGNQAYRVDAQSAVNNDYYQSKFSYHTVVNMLQEKFIKALNSSPGAKETLLDFGKTIDDSGAGKYRNDVIQYPDNPNVDVNKSSRLLVTCAIVTSRGNGVRELNPFSPQVSLQPIPVLGETFGINADIYPGVAGIGQAEDFANDSSVDQTLYLNPHQLYDSMGTTFSQKTGDTQTQQILTNFACSYFFEPPVAGKKKGGGGPMEVEAAPEA